MPHLPPGGAGDVLARLNPCEQQLACSDCHNPMAKISATGLLKKPTINETCYTCHQQQRAEFAKRSHMPLPGGQISCVDCHNPHGSTSYGRC